MSGKGKIVVGAFKRKKMDDAAFEDANELFMTWLTSQPDAFVAETIALHDYTELNGGRGLICRAPIAEDEVLFSVPRKSLLSWRNSSLSGRLPPGQVEELGSWNLLILTMLHENGRADSLWQPYFNILPDSFSTPMFWTEQEVAELQGSTLASKIGREEADQSYRDTILPILKRHADLFDLGRCSLQAFHRMGSLIMSYSFDAPTDESDTQEENAEDVSFNESEDEEDELEKVMCPLADLLNADTKLNNARLFYEPEALVMKSTKSIKSGEQIFNTYGELPNSDLLRRYGYVQMENSADIVELPGDMITSLFEMNEVEREARIDWLLDMEILDDAFELDETGKIPKEMLVTIELMAMPFAKFCKVKDTGDELPKGQKNTLTREKTLSVLRARLAQYSTSLEEDERILSLTEVPFNLRNAVVVRLGEKRILTRAMSLVSAWATEEKGQKKRNANGDEGGRSDSRKKTRNL